MRHRPSPTNVSASGGLGKASTSFPVSKLWPSEVDSLFNETDTGDSPSPSGRSVAIRRAVLPGYRPVRHCPQPNGGPRMMVMIGTDEIAALRTEIADLKSTIRGATIKPRDDWETIKDRAGVQAQTVRTRIRAGRIGSKRVGNVTYVRG